MAKLMEYLNALDQNAEIRVGHYQNPVKTMSDFGICDEIQAAIINKEIGKIAEYAGIKSEDSHWFEVLIVTF